MNGHWIIELSEMSAIAAARSIEETKAFISRQRETYRMPYEKYAEDRPRQWVRACRGEAGPCRDPSHGT